MPPIGSFDPTSFMDAVQEGANDTKVIPIPIAEWPATIVDPKMADWKNKDGTKSGWKITMMLKIDAPEVAAVTHREVNQVKFDVMLDIDPETGALEMGPGKNVHLGRLREAVGLNKPGEKWSVRMFDGRQLKVRIGHRTDDNGDIFADAKAVTALSA